MPQHPPAMLHTELSVAHQTGFPSAPAKAGARETFGLSVDLRMREEPQQVLVLIDSFFLGLIDTGVRAMVSVRRLPVASQRYGSYSPSTVCANYKSVMCAAKRAGKVRRELWRYGRRVVLRPRAGS